MTVPITGALMLGLGAWFFIFWPEMLYPAMIVAIPFTGTAVLNFEWANVSGSWGRSLEPWQFFFTLWMCREALSNHPPWHRAGWFLTRRARCGLFAFLAAVLVSLSVPLVLSGTTWVLKPGALAEEMAPLQLSSYNLTQTAYVAFGILFTVLVAAENSSSRRLFRTLRLYVGSCVFASAWGLFELWSKVTGHEYPYGVFNTSTNIAATGYQETVMVGGLHDLGRISSVAQEPSVLARLLLFALVALVISLVLRRPILGRRWDLIGVALIATTLLASTSSTAYFGLPLAMIVVGLALFRAGKPMKLYLVVAAAAILTVAFVLMMVPFARLVSIALVLEKFGSGPAASGAARLHSVSLAARTFLKYPLLGLGWPNVDSPDLLFNILANTGLVGLIAFASFVVPVFRGLWHWTKKRNPAAVVFMPIFVLAILLAQATSPSWVAGFFWLVLGLGAAAVVAARTEPFLKAQRQAAPVGRAWQSRSYKTHPQARGGR